jgi:hypothetical protein
MDAAEVWVETLKLLQYMKRINAVRQTHARDKNTGTDPEESTGKWRVGLPKWIADSYAVISFSTSLAYGIFIYVFDKPFSYHNARDMMLRLHGI